MCFPTDSRRRTAGPYNIKVIQQRIKNNIPAPTSKNISFYSRSASHFETSVQSYCTPVISNNELTTVSSVTGRRASTDTSSSYITLPTTVVSQTLSSGVDNDLEPAEETAIFARSKRKRVRKRKRLEPGLTATKRERVFVEHNYHDHSNDPDNDVTLHEPNKKQRYLGGVSDPFPTKLHDLLRQLEDDGLSSVIGWMPHGRAFAVHDKQRFINDIMPKYFKQSRYTSFQRQLNLYGFVRLSNGPDNGAYYNELFLRGKPSLCHKIFRTKCKGTGLKAASNPDTEPNFYVMPFVGTRRFEEKKTMVSVGSTQTVCSSHMSGEEPSEKCSEHKPIPSIVTVVKPFTVPLKTSTSLDENEMIDDFIIDTFSTINHSTSQEYKATSNLAVISVDSSKFSEYESTLLGINQSTLNEQPQMDIPLDINESLLEPIPLSGPQTNLMVQRAPQTKVHLDIQDDDWKMCIDVLL